MRNTTWRVIAGLILFIAAVAAGEIAARVTMATPLAASSCEYDVCLNIYFPDGDVRGHCVDLSIIGIRRNCDMQADGSCEQTRCSPL